MPKKEIPEKKDYALRSKDKKPLLCCDLTHKLKLDKPKPTPKIKHKDIFQGGKDVVLSQNKIDEINDKYLNPFSKQNLKPHQKYSDNKDDVPDPKTKKTCMSSKGLKPPHESAKDL